MALLYPTFTSETRTGDTDSSTNNVNENRTAVNTDAGDERTKAYRKAEDTYQSNQQLLKEAGVDNKRDGRLGYEALAVFFTLYVSKWVMALILSTLFLCISVLG